MSNIIELTLEGLDCASCSGKIEDRVNKLDGTIEAYFNFSTKVLRLEVKDEVKEEAMIDDVKKIVTKLEPHVKVYKRVKDRRKKAKVSNSGCCSGHDHSDHAHSSDGCCSGHNHSEHKHNGCCSDHDHGDHDEHEHGHDHTHDASNKTLIKIGIGAALFAAGFLFKSNDSVRLAIYLVAYIVIGGDVLLRAIKNISRGQVFDENFLMAIATVGAFLIGEYPEGVGVMLFYQVGEYFQGLAVNRSRKSIADLMDIRPDFANIKTDTGIKTVSVYDVNVEDIIVVKPGEKVPLDGQVIEGTSMVDTSALTGESVPRSVGVEDDILSGFINVNGLLTIKVKKEFGESTVAKILDMVENASAKKAVTEKFISKFARVYTPAVVIAAALLSIIPPMILGFSTFSTWFYRALTFLVISCPCALVISIPLGFFGGIGAASKQGILIKGGNYLEALNYVDTIVFDKTGTLTKGVFEVVSTNIVGELKADELIKYAAHAEVFSTHPIAKSIVKHYDETIDESIIVNYQEVTGHGISVMVDGKKVLAGNAKLMKINNVTFTEVSTSSTIVYIAVDDVYSGYIEISDMIKEDSFTAVEQLKSVGVKETIMLTGDNKSIAESVAKKIGINKVFAELLPQDKMTEVDRLEDAISNTKRKLAFVGDGINDAPVLARADVGIAMGGLGSDAAIEAADIVIMTDEPSKIVNAIKIAKKTNKIVIQNIVMSLGIKAIVMLLGALGMATMWHAVFADVGVALMAIFNSMRVLNTK